MTDAQQRHRLLAIEKENNARDNALYTAINPRQEKPE